MDTHASERMEPEIGYLDIEYQAFSIFVRFVFHLKLSSSLYSD